MDSLKVSKLADFLGTTEIELIKILNHNPDSIDVKTYDQALHYYRNCPKGSELEKIAYDKITQTGENDVANLKTFDQGIRFLSTVPKNSELEKSVHEKLLQLATTIQQAREIYEKTTGLMQQNALEKITNIGTIMLFEAEDFDQARQVYKKAIKNSVLQHVALTKMLELAQNIKQARIVYTKAPHSSELEKAAFTKVLGFTNNIDDAVILCNDVRRNSSLRILALERFTEISNQTINNSTNLFQIRQIYKLAPKRSIVERIAVQKMLELIQ